MPVGTEEVSLFNTKRNQHPLSPKTREKLVHDFPISILPSTLRSLPKGREPTAIRSTLALTINYEKPDIFMAKVWLFPKSMYTRVTMCKISCVALVHTLYNHWRGKLWSFGVILDIYHCWQVRSTTVVDL